MIQETGMIRKYLLPLLSAAGVVFAIFVVVNGSKPVPKAPPAAPPPESGIGESVAGTGLVEARSQNIAVAANVPGVITAVHLKVGDRVAKGAPLFELDRRSLDATLSSQMAAWTQAAEKLKRLLAAPRKEEIPPAEALVKEAQANFDDAKSQLDSATSLGNTGAISHEELTRRRYAFQAAESKLLNAQTNLALLKAGTWMPEINMAVADLEYAGSQLLSTQTAIDLLTVRAPVDGQVLQLNARVGEYAQAGPMASPLVLFGNVDTLRVRVDVDENEAGRVRRHALAEAYTRGNPKIKIPLHFEYIEPYIIPKKSLTGESTERVDTRVLQAIYSFQRGDLPVYVGQQLDVFISAKKLENDEAATKDAGEKAETRPEVQPAAGRDGVR
jgi:multidrug resistance efflux pump